MATVRRASTTLAAALFLLLSGCYPHPHDFVRTQEFSGVLLKGGTPMAGVSVSVSHARADTADYCINPEVVAVTDATGAFHVPPQVQKHLFTSILNPPNLVLQSMSVCFQAPGKRKLGAFLVSATDHKVKYDAVCDWNAHGTSPEWGICTDKLTRSVEPIAGIP